MSSAWRVAEAVFHGQDLDPGDAGRLAEDERFRADCRAEVHLMGLVHAHVQTMARNPALERCLQAIHRTQRASQPIIRHRVARRVQHRLRQQAHRQGWYRSTWACAALLCLAVGLGWWQHTRAQWPTLNGAALAMTPGAAVTVADGETLRWPDGTTLTARGAVRLRAPASPAEAWHLDLGSLHAQVAPQRARQPFAVQTTWATCQVLGTDFVATANPGGLTVSVSEGHVRLLRPTGADLDARAGQLAMIAGPLADVTRSRWSADALSQVAQRRAGRVKKDGAFPFLQGEFYGPDSGILYESATPLWETEARDEVRIFMRRSGPSAKAWCWLGEADKQGWVASFTLDDTQWQWVRLPMREFLADDLNTSGRPRPERVFQCAVSGDSLEVLAFLVLLP
jgi:ferric-dicitrate binding protein FerR (iron transport regulator)